DGRPAGFRLFQIKEDSIFRRLGLQDGDVVQRVNGTALDDPTSLLTFLGRLRNEPRVAVDIVRGGAAHTLVYDLRWGSSAPPSPSARSPRGARRPPPTPPSPSTSRTSTCRCWRAS